MDSCVKICVQTHLFLTANMSHSAFTESKTMETSWSVTRLNRCGQSLCQSFFMVSRSSWPLLSVFFVISRSSWSVVLIVVDSRCGQLFFVVSQRSSWSSWSVVVISRSSWIMFIFYGSYVHVFTETYGWGKPRSMSGQMYGGWVEHVKSVRKLDRNRSRMSIIT